MNLEEIKSHQFDDTTQEYSNRDSMIYALGLGYGTDPNDANHLQYLYEEGLRTVPSMAVVMAHPGFWAQTAKFNVSWMKLLHAEQKLEIHQPLPSTGKVIAKHSFHGVDDKGAGKGALVHQLRKIYNAETDEHLATLRFTLFLRGDGGCGSFGEKIAAPTALPEGEPEKTVDIPTLPQQALIYRLSGDWNPIHASPDIAKKAGFEQPILHGLCTFGLACRGVLEAYGDNKPEALKEMFTRFSSPVYPGETVRMEFFREGSNIRYRARVLERDVIVLDRGTAVLA